MVIKCEPGIFVVEECISSERLSDGCWYCGGLGEAWDHIVPRALGGSDDYDNLIPTCTSCNSSKGSKPLYKFRQNLKQKRLNYQFDTPSPQSIRGHVYRRYGFGFVSFVADDESIVIKDHRKWFDRKWSHT